MVLKESEAKEIYSILDRFYGPMRYFTPTGIQNGILPL